MGNEFQSLMVFGRKEEHLYWVLAVSSELFVMGASLTCWEGDQFCFQGGTMCKATLDFVEHQQSTRLASLLQCRPAQRLQHVVDTRGVPEPVEDAACRSPLDCFSFGNVLL